MVEQWSPKPPVASSNLVSPARIHKPFPAPSSVLCTSSKIAGKGLFFFSYVDASAVRISEGIHSLSEAPSSVLRTSSKDRRKGFIHFHGLRQQIAGKGLFIFRGDLIGFGRVLLNINIYTTVFSTKSAISLLFLISGQQTVEHDASDKGCYDPGKGISGYSYVEGPEIHGCKGSTDPGCEF